jgi:hypothetical protein
MRGQIRLALEYVADGSVGLLLERRLDLLESASNHHVVDKDEHLVADAVPGCSRPGDEMRSPVGGEGVLAELWIVRGHVLRHRARIQIPLGPFPYLRWSWVAPTALVVPCV